MYCLATWLPRWANGSCSKCKKRTIDKGGNRSLVVGVREKYELLVDEVRVRHLRRVLLIQVYLDRSSNASDSWLTHLNKSRQKDPKPWHNSKAFDSCTREMLCNFAKCLTPSGKATMPNAGLDTATDIAALATRLYSNIIYRRGMRLNFWSPNFEGCGDTQVWWFSPWGGTYRFPQQPDISRKMDTQFVSWKYV